VFSCRVQDLSHLCTALTCVVKEGLPPDTRKGKVLSKALVMNLKAGDQEILAITRHPTTEGNPPPMFVPLSCRVWGFDLISPFSFTSIRFPSFFRERSARALAP
jgi:hypothetical protein